MIRQRNAARKLRIFALTMQQLDGRRVNGEDRLLVMRVVLELETVGVARLDEALLGVEREDVGQAHELVDQEAPLLRHDAAVEVACQLDEQVLLAVVPQR